MTAFRCDPVRRFRRLTGRGPLPTFTTVRLKVEQIQLVGGAGQIDLGCIGLQGSSSATFIPTVNSGRITMRVRVPATLQFDGGAACAPTAAYAPRPPTFHSRPCRPQPLQ
jgi:hypothetical protein